jgi:isoquinoline 1-oxidoreductase beta subunit
VTTDHKSLHIGRREFLSTTATVGGAMVLGFWIPPATAEAQSSAASAAYRDPMVPEINAWLTIAPDNTVTIRVGQTEMGQGVFTNCPMIVAEELQCDWKKVRAEHASANRNVREKAPEWTLKVPGKGNNDPTGGGEPVMLGNATGVYRRLGTNSSGSVREGRYYLQLAGAEARERLLLAAATEWKVPVSALVAKDGVITHAASKRRMTYGELAPKAAQIQLPDPTNTVKLKTPDKFWLYGTEQKDLTTPLKVTGQAMYSIDVRMPNMLYAAAKGCPVWGGKVRSYNFDAVRNMPGVHSAVLFGQDDSKRPRQHPWDGHISGGVAIVADTWWHARKALDAMPIEWDHGPSRNVSSDSLLKMHLDSLMGEQGSKIWSEQGNVDTAMGQGARVVEATYQLPFLNHACMEPHSATVIATPNRVDIWTATQSPDACLRYVAEEAGLPQENVYVHTMFMGSGFGIDNQNPRAFQQAVAVAKTLNGRPVKLLWTREEDWGFGMRPRPMGVAHMRAALDAQGYPIAIDIRTAGQPYGGDQQYRGLTAWPYYVPHYRLKTVHTQSHIPCVPRRATGSSTNTFYQECFIDELAHAAGKDPLLYRRELIARNPTDRNGIGNFTPAQRGDWLKVLDTAAKMANWGSPLPEGWARGIGLDDRRRPTRNSTTAVAEIHTVSVSKQGQVRLHRVDIAFDQGFSLVNPLTAKKQIEGQIAWGWDDTMYQEGTIKDGQVVECNFDQYPVSRMNEYPREVNIQFVKSNHWLYGLGEEAIQQIAPAICNAVFKVTGKRIRSLPLKKHDLSWGNT